MWRFCLLMPALAAGQTTEMWTLQEYTDGTCTAVKSGTTAHALHMDTSSGSMLSNTGSSDSASDYPVLTRSSNCLRYNNLYMKYICTNNVTDIKFGIYSDSGCTQLTGGDATMSYTLGKRFAQGECVMGWNFAFTGFGKLDKPLPICAHPCVPESACVVAAEAASPSQAADQTVAIILGLLFAIPLGAQVFLTWQFKKGPGQDSE